MKRTGFIVLLLVATLSAVAQSDDISFVVEKIKANYPGYREKTEGKDFDKFVAEARRLNMPDTFKTMATITSFFKDRHLDLFRVSQAVDSVACKKNLNLTVNYLDTRKKLKPYEGYWITESRHCVIGMRQVQDKPLKYEGYIVKCLPGNAGFPGMVLCSMEQREGQHFFSLMTGLRTGLSSYVPAEFRNDSVVTIGPYYKLRRLKGSTFAQLPELSQPQDTATGKWLNPKTYLLTIKSSTAANGKIADSIIKADTALSTQCEHLIIDVRGNTGGRILAYEPVLPLLYTNPFYYVYGTLYATLDESNRKLEELRDYLDSGGRDVSHIYYQSYWAKWNQDSVGRFYSFMPDPTKLDHVLEYPKRVSIIADFGCQSACEMFLLMAQQSKKVKLFGEHTMGALDYLNFYPRSTPSGKYKLYIATTRRTILPGGSKLDGKGIQPDVFIPDSVPDWVDLVNHYEER